jgi:hypothetical protein
MGRYKVGLIIPHPEEQKWDKVWKIFRTPNLNLPTLAALIPEHWDIEIQDELVGPIDFTREYDLVLITVTTSVAVRSYEVARIFRKRGAKVVLGGIHPSALPEEAGQHADAVVIGEGELTLPRLLGDFKKGKLGQFYRSSRGMRYPRVDPLRNSHHPESGSGNGASPVACGDDSCGSWADSFQR